MTTITEDLQSVKGTRIADMNRLSDADNVSVHELQEAIKNLQKKNERLKCELDRRKRVEARLKKKNAHLELIRRIQNDIPMTGDIETILNKAAESMGKMFGYSKVSVNLLDSARAEVVHLVGWNQSGTPTPHGHRQKLGEGMIGTVAQTKKKIIANDVTVEPSYLVHYQTKTKSELSLPLLIEDRIVGVLDIQHIKKNAFTFDDVTVLQALANYIAYVIEENKQRQAISQSEAQSRRRMGQSALLYEVGRHMTGELELKVLLSKIVHAVCDTFHYYGVMIMLYNGEETALEMQSIAGGYATIFRNDFTIKRGEGMIGRAAQTGEIQLSGDVSKNKFYVKKADEITRSELTVPIIKNDRVLGVLDIQTDEYDAFDNTDVEAMQTLCTQISAAIDNARLFEKAQREIAERKKIENELKVEKAYLEQLFANSPEAIVLVENDGKILKINRAFSNLFNYSEKEAEGKKIDALVAPGELYEEAFSLTRNITAENELVETVRQRKDGTTLNVSIIGSPVLVNGEQVAIYGVYRDITHRIEAEQQRSLLLAELEHANQELKDFAYIVSHDLKAPLRGIGSLIDWITSDYMEKLDANGREMLCLLANRTRRMNDLIEGILQYSRVGRIREDKVLIDLNVLMKEVIDLLAIPSNIEVRVGKNMPIILGEKTRIEQIFQNLIGNAVKYMDKEQGEINVSVTSHNGNWRFAIADNGPGIEAKYFDKIFQIFQTLAPRDEIESTGVGLTLVKKIIEMYGGKIWIESEVGSGSTFIFELPKHIEEEAERMCADEK